MKRDLILRQTGYEMPQLPVGVLKRIARHLPYDGIVAGGLFYKGGRENENPKILMVGDYATREPTNDELYAVRAGMHELLEGQRPENIDMPDNTTLDRMTPWDIGILLGLSHPQDTKRKAA